MKKNIKTIMLVVFSIIMGIGISFIACKKIESSEITGEKSSYQQIEQPSRAPSYCFVCISKKGWEGEGSGQDKICVEATRRCWIWFQWVDVIYDTPNNPNNPNPIKCNHIAAVSDEGDGTITLDFKYEYNDKVSLQELFENDFFVIEEDIVEAEDNYLLWLRGSSSSCKISADSYSITRYKEGVKVVLPITIE
jgi:hypothetical protein